MSDGEIELNAACDLHLEQTKLRIGLSNLTLNKTRDKCGSEYQAIVLN